HAIPERFHFIEEAHSLGVSGIGGGLLEFFEKVPLLARQILRRLHLDLNVKVARKLRAQNRHSLSTQAELLAGFGALRHFDAGAAAIDGGHLDLSAKRRGRHGDWHAAEEVRAVALENVVGKNRQK